MATQHSKTTTNHSQIQRWAEARHAQPARVKGTGGNGDPGMVRLDFPGYSGKGKLEPISWDDWFEAFDDNDLALVYQEKTASGKRSNFNKLISRSTSGARKRGSSSAARRKRSSRSRTSGRARKSGSRSTARKTTGRSNPRSKGTGARKTAGASTRRASSRRR